MNVMELRPQLKGGESVGYNYTSEVKDFHLEGLRNAEHTFFNKTNQTSATHMLMSEWFLLVTSIFYLISYIMNCPTTLGLGGRVVHTEVL